MKLLDTNGGNTKLSKNNKDIKIRVAGLSLFPNDTICTMRHIAECAKPCLKASGRGVFDNVEQARQSKTDFYMSDRPAFIAQLIKEIVLFEKLCIKQGVGCYIRLNVISDIRWELAQNGSIPQLFPNVNFYDYTKIAKRLTSLPDNYQLMFSYSRAEGYQKQVDMALKTSVPMSVVFYGPMPDTFMGKKVIDGDGSDIENLQYDNCIIGLKYKTAKGQGVDPADSVFIVDTNLIQLQEVA